MLSIKTNIFTEKKIYSKFVWGKQNQSLVMSV